MSCAPVGAPARVRTGVDATTILTGYLLLLWFIPSPMVVPSLGSAGAPSTLVAVGTFVWWAWFVLRRSEPTYAGAEPVRTAVLAWLLAMVVVYAHAMSGPIPSDEISVADSGMLRLVGMAGVMLLACDGIVDQDRLRVLVRRLALAAGLVALLGLLQYFTGELYVDRIRIPGLAAGTAEWTLGTRSGFARPSGTSTSPIEYGVVLGMTLPLVIACATGRGRHRRFFQVLMVAMIVSIYFSMSRSAYLCALMGVLVLAASWSARRRWQALATLLVMSAAMYVAVPGLLGSIQGLFSNAGEDPSISSRTGSYDIAGEFIASSPLLGRGFGTFLPKYWILDNGYLGLLIEGGVIGLAGLVAVIVLGLRSARQARKRLVDEDDRQLAQALLASIAAGACGLAFFDTFAFPQTAGCFFLLIGLAGASRRLTREAGEGADAALRSWSARAST